MESTYILCQEIGYISVKYSDQFQISILLSRNKKMGRCSSRDLQYQDFNLAPVRIISIPVLFHRLLISLSIPQVLEADIKYGLDYCSRHQ